MGKMRKDFFTEFRGTKKPAMYTERTFLSYRFDNQLLQEINCINLSDTFEFVTALLWAAYRKQRKINFRITDFTNNLSVLSCD